MTHPAPESLALSASIFTSSIDSWIPAKFGPKQSDVERNAQFDKRLRDAAIQGDHEKLGAGHPDIGVYKPKGPSLVSLEKKLGKVERGGGKVEKETLSKVEVDSDQEEESRSRSVSSVKKRSNGVHDLLLGKKKAKSKVQLGAPPLLNLTPNPSSWSIETSTSGANPTEEVRTPLTAATSSPGGSGEFPFAGPVALDSPQAQRVLDEKLFRKRLREEEDEEDISRSASVEVDIGVDASQNGSSQGLSKSAKRREARKKAKLAKSAQSTS